MRRAVQAETRSCKGAHLPCRGSELTALRHGSGRPISPLAPHTRIYPPHTGAHTGAFPHPTLAAESGAPRALGSVPRAGDRDPVLISGGGRAPAPGQQGSLGRPFPRGHRYWVHGPKGRLWVQSSLRTGGKPEQGSFKFGRPLPKGHRQWVQGRDRAGGKPEHRGAESESRHHPG